MTPFAAKRINALFLLVIAIVLMVAFYYQWFHRELPCPLCLFQRIAFLGMAVGFLLNDRFGIKPAHYGISMLGAIFGLIASMRQVLLHILPGDAGYGSTFLGLHFYSWSFVLYMGFIFAMTLMMLATQSYALESKAEIKKEYTWPMKAVAILIIVLAIANLSTTFFECGLGVCPDNPVQYRYHLR